MKDMLKKYILFADEFDNNNNYKTSDKILNSSLELYKKILAQKENYYFQYIINFFNNIISESELVRKIRQDIQKSFFKNHKDNAITMEKYKNFIKHTDYEILLNLVNSKKDEYLKCRSKMNYYFEKSNLKFFEFYQTKCNKIINEIVDKITNIKDKVIDKQIDNQMEKTAQAVYESPAPQPEKNISEKLTLEDNPLPINNKFQYQIPKPLPIYQRQHKDEKVPDKAREFLEYFKEASMSTGFGVPLLMALAFRESSFNPNVISSKGAGGLMQILNPSKEQMLPRKNILDGAQILRNYYDMFGGNIKYALMAYNWGPTNLRNALRNKRRIPGSVVQFANNVLGDIKKYI